MNQVFKIAINADLENLKEVRSFIENAGEDLGVPHDTVGDLCLVVDEAITNIILHGYDGRDGVIEVHAGREDNDLVIRISDQAKTFDFDAVETPHLDESLSERAYGGMGVYLIRKLTDEAKFYPLPNGGNELRLVKRGVIPE